MTIAAMTEAPPVIMPVERAGHPVRHLIEVEQVEKIFGDLATGHKALEAINVAIEEKEFFTLLGPSGCGKTTLLRMIAGFENPTTGEIRLHGKRCRKHCRRVERPVNMVFQNYALFPHLTVYQNVAFGLEMLNWKKADITARVDEMLSLVKLSQFPRPQARRSFPADSNSAWLWPVPSLLAPRCCCWTSRFRPWI